MPYDQVKSRVEQEFHLHGGISDESEIAQLIWKLKAKAEAKGLRLSRWCAVTDFREKIHWAVHAGPRTKMYTQLPEGSYVIELLRDEGTTSRCKAYKELERLYNLF